MISFRHLAFSIFGAISLAISTANASPVPESALIISDIDDTFKITNVGSVWNAIVNGLFSRKAFLGMDQFYQEQHYPTVFVSGSVEQLRGILDGFLESHSVSRYRLFLRKTYLQNVRTYKASVISGVIQNLKPGVKVILVGDDTESDPEAFLDVKNAFPDRIAEIYIRAVRNRSIPEGHIAFTSAIELALRENRANRFSNESTQSVIDAFMSYADEALIFPDYAYCPRRIEWSKLAADTNTANAIHIMESRLEVYCQRRTAREPEFSLPRTVAPSDPKSY